MPITKNSTSGNFERQLEKIYQYIFIFLINIKICGRHLAQIQFSTAIYVIHIQFILFVVLITLR